MSNDTSDQQPPSLDWPKVSRGRVDLARSKLEDLEEFRSSDVFTLEGEVVPQPIARALWDEVYQASAFAIAQAAHRGRQLDLGQLYTHELEEMLRPADELTQSLAVALQRWQQSDGKTEVERQQQLRNVFDNEFNLDRLRSDLQKCVSTAEAIIGARAGDIAIELQQATDQVNRITALLNQSRTELEDAQKAARESRTTAALAPYAALFEERAAHHETQSETWLFNSFGVFVVALVASVLLFVVAGVDRDATDGALVNALAARLAVSFALYTAAFLSYRTYRSHLHNATVNRHRMLALNSLEQIQRTANLEAAQDAVLLSATQAVFAHQATGFERTKSAPSLMSPAEISALLDRST